MKRHLLTVILSGFLGSLVLASNAEACHRTKCACAPTTCAAVHCPAPCPPPAPVCETACAPKKCGGGLFSCFKGLKLGHRKCAPRTHCETVAYCPTTTYTGTFTGTYASPQTSAQH
jgi:hypothetical protein